MIFTYYGYGEPLLNVQIIKKLSKFSNKVDGIPANKNNNQIDYAMKSNINK